MDAIELLDEIDEKGHIRGPVLRSEVHKKGLWHRAVHIWLINGRGDILVQKRSMEKENHPGMWDISGAGHITSGMNSVEAAIREVKEELGLDITENELEKIGELKSSSTSNDGAYINNELNDVFIVRTHKKIEEMKMQKEEVADLRFFKLAELKKEIDQKNPDFVLHRDEYPLLFDYLGI